ncbi:MAG: DEAD/DEAH box helicase [Thermoanaerobaculales bacterium]|jgi:ATP-dependent Lhr-like helicase|nr:DEAD/DEAH box helicase [Thermoanaerobaculales bacterium]
MSASAPNPLSLFSPPVASWFADRYAEPTDVQSKAWPVIASGEHCLLTAPTGSGKTFAAFLWAVDRLLSGQWEGGATRVLYVSPLKALGNDIRRNLTEPLSDLENRFAEAGLDAAAVRIETRTGDTPQAARRRMQRAPPEILITTPETFNILLTSKSGRRMLAGVRSLILDEIHAVAGSKRGVHLMTAVERLAMLAGEIQRVSLSATVRPLERVAAWVGGYAMDGDPGRPDYRPRRVTVVAGAIAKAVRLEVTLPSVETDGENREPDAFWSSFGRQLRSSIARNRSTLIFGNARRSVEKITRFINETSPDRMAYSHHGALSREIRSVVEKRLKAGELKAIVATSSLELGIDVGAIDEVVMVQTPPSVASTLQRLGRSGHSVGETSRGRLIPLLSRDLLEAAVVAKCVLDGEIEEVKPTSGALDVLAQVLLSMVVASDWTVEELFAAIRCAEPYHQLPRHHFDLVLEMLAGRYSSSRLRSLRPMVSIDAVNGAVRARPGAERLLYLSGGTIPDRGYFQLRVEGSGALLGELDEEFVWERSVGDTFTLGVQTWRVQKITHNDVLVAPAHARSAMAPFWRAEELDRSSFVSQRIAEFLEDIEDRLDDPAMAPELGRCHALSDAAAAALLDHLRQQRDATGPLPHRHRILVEHTSPPAGRGEHRQMVLHTLWGGRVNRPFATALSAAWEARWGMRPEIVHGADCVVVVYPAGLEVEDVFSLVRSAELEDLLRRSVERTGFFGARFREAAGRALLLPRAGRGKRVPLWVNRQRSKELLDAVRTHGDFPLVLEAWRTCLQDEYELDVLRHRLDEVADGRVAVHHVRTETPSPFTAQVAWKQTNELMYEDDVPTANPDTRPDLVREMALSAHLRPRIPAALVDDLQARLHRTAPGWSPRSASELLEWLKERLLVPSDEWNDLIEAITRDHDMEADELLREIAHRAVIIESEGTLAGLVCAVENLPRIEAALPRVVEDDDLASVAGPGPPTEALEARRAHAARLTSNHLQPSLAELLTEWLRCYGPVPSDWLAQTLGLDARRLDEALDELRREQVIVADELVEDAAGIQICDRVNLERLLRMARAEARPSIEPAPASTLPLLLAEHHQLGTKEAVPEDLQQALERLFGMALPVELWETEILPARLDPMISGWLDALLAESDLRWVGAGPKRIFLALDGELDLFREARGNEDLDNRIAELFPHRAGRYAFEELVRTSGLGSAEVTRRLWELAWAGRVTSDGFDALRRGLETKYTAGAAPPPEPGVRRDGRRRFDRWRRERPFSGSWLVLPAAPADDDDLLAQDDELDRARIVLDRYGIVFRRLLDRELPQLRWGAVFRALRLLELGGEVVAGHFIEGPTGLQFASHQTIGRLRDGLDDDRIWWINAMDPVSPCSLGLELDEWPLPRRVPGNHLVFHGRRLVVVSQRRGSDLAIRVAPDHPQIEAYLRLFHDLLGREQQPLKRIDLQLINGEPAASSPYRTVFQELFHVVRQPNALRLTRKF